MVGWSCVRGRLLLVLVGECWSVVFVMLCGESGRRFLIDSLIAKVRFDRFVAGNRGGLWAVPQAIHVS